MSDECARCGEIMILARGAIVRASGEVLEFCSDDCFAEGSAKESRLASTALTSTLEVVHDRG
jgi:hypothetical protein